jgi:hypothetical protein
MVKGMIFENLRGTGYSVLSTEYECKYALTSVSNQPSFVYGP